MLQVRLDNLRPVPVVAAGIADRKTPVRQFRLFPYGVSKTTKGDMELTQESALEVMRRYQEYTGGPRGGWLDIDIAHLSQTNEDNVNAHVSAGRFRLELRDDGLWVTDITYTPDVYEGVASEKWRYYSPVVNYDDSRAVVEVLQLALTNIPAMYGTHPLALSTSTHQSWPVDDGAWDQGEADKRVRAYCGSQDGSLDGVDLKRYAKFFAYVDDPKLPSTWKGMIGDIRNGKPVIVKRAVQALAGSIQGARGKAIQVPADELPKLKALVASYYKQWDATVPWAKENQSMKFSRIVMLSLLADKTFESSPELLESKPGVKHILEAIWSATCAAYPGSHLEDIYDGYAVLGMEGPGIVEKYMKVPFELKDGVVILGKAEEVEKAWMSKSAPSASAEQMSQLSERARNAESLLLSSTGKSTISAAIGEVERLQSVEKASAALSTRLEKLEGESFGAKRTVLLDSAKRDGKWTAALEAQADRVAGMARRLGEDPLAAMSDVFSSAPVVVHTGAAERQQEQESRNTDGLTPEQEEICKEQARMLSIDPVAYRAAFVANIRRIR